MSTASGLLLLAGCAQPPSSCADPGGCESTETSCAQGVCAVFAQDAGGIALWLDNRNAVSVTVQTEFPERENLEPSVEPPVETIVPALRRVEAVRFVRVDLERATELSASQRVVFGSLRATHDATARYAMPFGGDESRLLGQGVNGGVTHVDAYRYAFDFDMPVGTSVLAARGGTIVRVIDGFETGAFDKKLKARGNVVMVVHADETLATYAHLSPGIGVREGQSVEVGQRLGLSGATGYAKGPHLHFQVGKIADDVEGATVPIRFEDGTPDGYVPESGRRYGPSPELRVGR